MAEKSPKRFLDCRGFTVFELLTVIIMVGVFVSWLDTKIKKFSEGVKVVKEASVVARVREGINLHFVDSRRGARRYYPVVLDDANPGPCLVDNRCFNSVIFEGAEAEGWIKLSDSAYRSPVNKTNVWSYGWGNGRFTKTKS